MTMLSSPFKRIRNAPLSPSGAPPDPLAGVTSATASPSAQRSDDAYVAIVSTLGEWGLASLADWVWEQLVEGRSDAEIERDIRSTPEFKARFPAIEQRTKAGLAPLSPAEYVAYEQQARQLMRAAGLPETFYDTAEDFTTYLSGDVSISELNDRIQLGRQAMYESDPEALAALRRDYGATEGELTALFLDSARALPLVERQWRAAQIGGSAARTGYGATTREQNERLASLGVTAEQARQGFGMLGESRELFQSLDRGEDVISTDDQLDAVFGDNANARQRVERRRAKRRAAFQGGGSFASTQNGLVGLGDTS